MVLAVEKWLKDNHLDQEAVIVEKTVKPFLSEMEKGLAPVGSSLPMIPTYINMGCSTPMNKSVIAIDAGGTNLRISCVHFDAAGKPSLESFENSPMPGTGGEITTDEFFDAIAERVLPVAKGRERIGFCFSFPAKIHPNKDGEIIGFDKEMKVSGAKGRMLGEGLLAALAKKGISHIKKIVVLNDTVATALGAKAQNPDKHYGGYAGLILGTGFNMCYNEKCENITKEHGLAGQDSVMINMESAFFDKMTQGPIDRELDANSREPGKNLMEKMVSGAYIGEVFRRSIMKAARDGLFTFNSTEKIVQAATRELSDFLDEPYNGPYSELCANEDDRGKLLVIGKSIVDRAARLASSNVLAAAIKSGEGKNVLRPIFVSAEGTTLYRMKGLKQSIDYHIRRYCDAKGDLFIELGKVDNTTVFGSAIAAFM